MQRLMNSRGHLLLSIVKSCVRISGCVIAIATYNWIWIAGLFGAAELLGIAEELVDNR